MPTYNHGSCTAHFLSLTLMCAHIVICLYSPYISLSFSLSLWKAPHSEDFGGHFYMFRICPMCFTILKDLHI